MATISLPFVAASTRTEYQINGALGVLSPVTSTPTPSSIGALPLPVERFQMVNTNQKKRWADYTPTPGADGSTPRGFAAFMPTDAPSASGWRTDAPWRQGASRPSAPQEPMPEFGPTPDCSPVRMNEQKGDIGCLLFKEAFGPGINEDLVDITGLPVKNTFIHYTATGDESPFVDTSQLPPKASSAPANVILSTSARPLSPMVMQQPGSSIILQQGMVSGSPPQVMSPPKQIASPQQLSPIAGLASVGAALHGTGECKPCAWFWKPGGCEHQAACGFCHACPEGEIRRRKKEKVQTMRNRPAGGGSYTQAAQPVRSNVSQQQQTRLNGQQAQQQRPLLLSQLI